MIKAIGMLEYQTVSAGIRGADLLVKSADIEIIEAQTVCPGKYIVIYTGQLSDIKVATDHVKEIFGDKLIDHFILGNPHETILPALYGTSLIKEKKALGVLETFSGAAIFIAADEAAKSAMVTLIELRVARGMCGKSYMMLTGEVAAVEAAIEKAKHVVGKTGMLVDAVVISNPDSKLWGSIV